jgi:Scramblase
LTKATPSFYRVAKSCRSCVSIMDRGTPTLKAHVENCTKMHVRQARRGWLQECLCCDSKSDFKYFVGGSHVAESEEESTHLCRCCLAPHHPFLMGVTEVNANSELVEVDRPLRFCVAPCKCCCMQEAVVMSGGEKLGEIRETWWWRCVTLHTIGERTNGL